MVRTDQYGVVALGGYWGFSQGGLTGAVSAMYIVLVLAAMEVSLSFDNAVVNAGVLKDMSLFWRKMFLTVGIFVAVFVFVGIRRIELRRPRG